MKQRKIIYAICLLGVVLLNIFYVNYQFYILLWLVILIPICSLLIFLMAKHDVEMYFRMPNQKIIQGEKTGFQVKMANEVPLLLVNSEVDFVLMNSNENNKQNKILYMNTFFDKYAKDVEFNTQHCGIVTIQSDKVIMYDYLRIFKKTIHFKGQAQIVVFPTLLPAEEKNTYEGLDGVEFANDEWTILNGDSDEIVDIRNYQNGDSMNKIHWKLSVKMDDFIVKKFGDEDNQCIRILVDLTLREISEFRSHLDRIYQMAYSIGNYYVRTGTKTSFIFWDGKEEQLKECSFITEEELDASMLVLMRQACSGNAGSKTEAAFEECEIKRSEKPYWITAIDQQSRNYEVVNVVKDDLEQIMETLYKM